MVRLLKKPIGKPSKLPATTLESGFLATEKESEQRWDDLFAKSHDMLAEMAAEAIREDKAGLTQPLDPDEM